MSAFTNLLTKLNSLHDVPLKNFSTLKVGGTARDFVIINQEHELAELQKACLEYQQNFHIVSGGSNTLFSDHGFDGVVIKLGAAFDYIQTSNNLNLSIGAATSFAKVTKHALALGWSHAVGWSGTPGLIGGAVRMNAGTRLGELKDAFARAYIIHNSNKVIFEKKDILFNYRSSSFPNNSIITKIDLIYDYEYLKPVAELLNQAHEYRLKRRASQPSTASLGSFFTNPYPHFAAQLIESCNMKGYSYKSAQISPLHANFIINNGHASAADILSLAHAAQKAVREKFGVILKPEVKFVGIFETNLLS